MRPINWF